MAYSQKQGEVRKTAIQILDCTLCLDIVNVPKTLRCGHSFCKNCLANVLKSKLLIDDRLRAPSHPMYIVCPLCKTDSVAFNSLADLKSNFLVNQLVDAYYYEMEQQIPPSVCICGEKAKLQCYRCRDAYCSGCSKIQMTKPCAMQYDEVVSITKNDMKHFFVKLQKEEDEAICKDHSLPLEFCCTICKEAICMDCFLLSHKQHETKTLKYAKNEALDLVDTIESIRNENASLYDRIHEQALQMQKHLEESEGDITKQMEDTEMKIHALIWSIFKKTKLHYKGILGETKKLLQDTLNHCETTKMLKGLSEASKKLKEKWCEIGDRQLACMLKELVMAKEEDEKETVRMEETEQTLHKTHDAPILVADQRAIFDSVIDLFKHINLDLPRDERSLSNEFTFEGYMNGEYLDEVVLEEVNDTFSSSGEDRNEIPEGNFNHPTLMTQTPSWYFGKLQPTQAERILLSFGENGMFIVRDCEIRQNDLLLSVRDDDGIKNYRISELINQQHTYQEKTDRLPLRFFQPFPLKRPILQSMINEDPWEVPRNSISITKILPTRDSVHQILEGRWNDSIEVSVRRPIIGRREDFLKQTELMKKLSHENLVQLYATCSDCNPPLIVTEPVRNGYLLEYLHEHSRNSLKLQQLIDIAFQVASGMAYLEKHNVVHRGLAARNIAVVAKNKFKIDNFILSKYTSSMDEFEVQHHLPTKWTAPEALFKNKFSIKSDVWSFGILLYEIVTYGREPYPGMPIEEVMYRLKGSYRVLKPEECPNYFFSKMLMCWKENTEERPTFSHLERLFKMRNLIPKE